MSIMFIVNEVQIEILSSNLNVDKTHITRHYIYLFGTVNIQMSAYIYMNNFYYTSLTMDKYYIQLFVVSKSHLNKLTQYMLTHHNKGHLVPSI